jgi:hypothetical protein
MPVWHTELEIYVPDSVIHGLEICLFFAVMESAQPATPLIFSQPYVEARRSSPRQFRKRDLSGNVAVRRFKSCRDDGLVYAKRDVVLSNH